MQTVIRKPLSWDDPKLVAVRPAVINEAARLADERAPRHNTTPGLEALPPQDDQLILAARDALNDLAHQYGRERDKALEYNRVADRLVIEAKRDVLGDAGGPWREPLINGVVKSLKRLREEKERDAMAGRARGAAATEWVRERIEKLKARHARELEQLERLLPPACGA
jgi:hypothetical protein